MKKAFTLLASILLISVVWAQSPQRMSYQAVIRNSSNSVITSTAIGMQISILQGSASGTVVYTETQTPTTKANGLVSIEIGGGTGFSTIDWSAGPYFIKTETDPTGGANYTISGTSQLLSVPYALHAATAETLTGTITETDPVFVAWDKNTGINITSSQVSDFEASVTDNSSVIANTAKKSYPSADAEKLAGIASGAEVNVNADWNAASGDAQIINKPTISFGTNPGDMQYWNGTVWVMVPVGMPGQFLQLTTSNKPAWSGAAYSALITLSASSITNISATSGGNITNDGGATITARGVSWSISENPTIEDNKTSDGTGTGIFASSLTGLTIGTTYYVRAYATNSAGTVYGNQVSFTTVAVLSTIATTTISTITNITATSGGNVTNDGGATVIVRGVCWSISANPTIADSKTIDGEGTGIFTSLLAGLTIATIYYVRAYATNNAGTAYGNQISFVTIGIGGHYQGGIIAYILQSGDPGYDAGTQHGLIVAPTDQSPSLGTQWYNGSYTTTGVTSTTLGTGNANTNAIVASQGEGNYAAKLCSDLAIDGFSDWYLPSKDELNKLYLNKETIGVISSYPYWSSTESDNVNAWYQSFNDGFQDNPNKNYKFWVRAVRSF